MPTVWEFAAPSFCKHRRGVFEAAAVSAAAFGSAHVGLYDEISHPFGWLAMRHVEKHLVIALRGHRVGKTSTRYEHRPGGNFPVRPAGVRLTRRAYSVSELGSQNSDRRVEWK